MLISGVQRCELVGLHDFGYIEVSSEPQCLPGEQWLITARSNELIYIKQRYRSSGALLDAAMGPHGLDGHRQGWHLTTMHAISDAACENRLAGLLL